MYRGLHLPQVISTEAAARDWPEGVGSGLSMPARSMPMFSHRDHYRARISFPAIVTAQVLPSEERAVTKWIRSRPLKTLIVR